MHANCEVVTSVAGELSPVDGLNWLLWISGVKSLWIIIHSPETNRHCVKLLSSLRVLSGNLSCNPIQRLSMIWRNVADFSVDIVKAHPHKLNFGLFSIVCREPEIFIRKTRCWSSWRQNVTSIWRRPTMMTHRRETSLYSTANSQQNEARNCK